MSAEGGGGEEEGFDFPLPNQCHREGPGFSHESADSFPWTKYKSVKYYGLQFVARFKEVYLADLDQKYIDDWRLDYAEEWEHYMLLGVELML